MSALVDEMFSVRQMPWHGQGHILADYPQNWDEARTLAGLDWEPVPEPVYELSGIDGEGQPVYAKIDGFKKVARSDTRATLGITSDTYAIINHSAFGEIFEAVLQQSNVRAETGGCLDGGKMVWMLIKLDEPVVIKGDKSLTMPYLGLTSKHTGNGGCTLRATGVRIVCANTFAASEMEGERHGATFTFRHTKNWRDRITDARQAVTAARQEIRQYVQIADSLMGVKITQRQERLFVAEFIPEPPAGLATDRVLANVRMSREKLTALLASPTVEGAGVRGTAYGLVQAAGEYLDHVRKAQTWETKLGRTLLRNEALKGRATKMALAAAKA